MEVFSASSITFNGGNFGFVLVFLFDVEIELTFVNKVSG